MRRVAVIGSGVAGLAAARGLQATCAVTLFEAAARFGGHAHTVEVTLDGPGDAGPVTHGVDTGFLVYNERTYPRLTRLFAELGVETAASDMSFSVQARADGIEWSGSDLAGLFAQPANALRPRFWRMLADVARFNRLATRLATAGDPSDATVDGFLARHRFSQAFADWYFLPMVACIWSCSAVEMRRFPMATMARFCHNHGLLQIADRPAWRTVRGGSRLYVERVVRGLADARAATPVRRLRRLAAGGVEVESEGAGRERFDAVVLACHSDQALGLLGDDAGAAERRVLGAIRFHANRAVLHTDTTLLPRQRRAWAAWNCERGAGGEAAPVCLHYAIDRLQPLPFGRPVIVSMNPLREPAPERVLAELDYAHPVLDAAAVDAQSRLPALQGERDTWYCGAWTGNGFHEDGLASGLAAAASVERRFAAAAGRPTMLEAAA